MEELIEGITAVAVSRSEDGMYPLRWAVQNLVGQGSSLHLVHVYPPLREIPIFRCRRGRSMPSQVDEIPVEEANSDVVAQMTHMREMVLGTFKMKKYKQYCKDRQVKPTFSLIKSDSIGEALVDHINQLGIAKIVIGSGTSRYTISRQAEYVKRHAPDFCEVIAICKDGSVSISRGEIQSVTFQMPPDWNDEIESLQNGFFFTPLRPIEPSIGPSSHNVEQEAIKYVEPEYSTNKGDEALKEELKKALKELELQKKQSSEEKMKQEVILEVLEETKRNQKKLKRLLYYKTIMCGEGVSSLRESKREAEMNRQQVVALSINLQNTEKALDTETRLRRNAEENTRQEILLKREIFSDLKEAKKTYTKYGFEELEEATNKFSEEVKLGEGGSGCVFKGTLRHTVSAIKLIKQDDGFGGSQEFQHKVELLSQIHHPHIVMMLGACPEKNCIVYEYMANGSLQEFLVKKPHALPWYIRFRVCYEVASALLFLNSSQEEPIIHSPLKLSNIFMDHHFVSKIGGIGLLAPSSIPNNLEFMEGMDENLFMEIFSSSDLQYNRSNMGTNNCWFGPECDVYALGIVILQILTGMPPSGITDIVEAALQNDGLSPVLDTTAGDWPIQESTELALVGLQCTWPQPQLHLELPTLLCLLKNIQRVAEMEAANAANKRSPSSSSDSEPTVPNVYVCPITKEIMKDPHIAADGFTYEYENIKSWVSSRNNSPMTNLPLANKTLIPNRSLRSAIDDWESKASTSTQETY